MQKCIALLLFILNPFVACAMENDSSSFFASWYSYLPEWLTSSSVSLSPMQQVQVDKNEFEELLYVSTGSYQLLIYRCSELQRLSLNSLINDNPVEFLLYCYNQAMHGNLVSNFAIIDDSLLNTCKKVRLNGYSALGAAIIATHGYVRQDKYDTAEDGSIVLNEYFIKVKPYFIQALMQDGFTLTEKDRTLVALELYDAIPAEHKQTMILLLNDKQESYFSVLPHDVRRLIVSAMVRSFKKEHWLCVLLQSVL